LDSAETLVRANFRRHLAGGELFGLPLGILARVIDVQQCEGGDLNSLFEFLLACLDRFGRPASCFFSGFEMSSLNVEQFMGLNSRSDFEWCFVANSMRVKLSGMVEKASAIELQRKRISDSMHCQRKPTSDSQQNWRRSMVDSTRC
jgi:hypothetical protein